jgi:hypothetical protein
MLSKLNRPLLSSVRKFHSSPPKRGIGGSVSKWFNEESTPYRNPWRSTINAKITPVHKACYDDAATKREMLDRLATYLSGIENITTAQFHQQQKTIFWLKAAVWGVGIGSFAGFGTVLFASPGAMQKIRDRLSFEIDWKRHQWKRFNAKDSEVEWQLQSSRQICEYQSRNGPA